MSRMSFPHLVSSGKRECFFLYCFTGLYPTSDYNCGRPFASALCFRISTHNTPPENSHECYVCVLHSFCTWPVHNNIIVDALMRQCWPFFRRVPSFMAVFTDPSVIVLWGCWLSVVVTLGLWLCGRLTLCMARGFRLGMLPERMTGVIHTVCLFFFVVTLEFVVVNPRLSTSLLEPLVFRCSPSARMLSSFGWPSARRKDESCDRHLFRQHSCLCPHR